MPALREWLIRYTENNQERGISLCHKITLLNLKEDCPYPRGRRPESKAEYDNMKELLKLKRENDELRKDAAFLKKAAAFFAKEID